MANLAIKGHPTRSKEVIEILEMLGGTNRDNCWGIFENRLYLINAFGDIEDKSLRDNSNYQVYTLEEFIEKYPYKVGDKVKVKETGKDVTIEGMSWRNGCEVIYDTCYNNNCVSFYSAEELQPYKEETMDKANKAVFDANAQCCDIMKSIIDEEKEPMGDNNLYDKLDFTSEPSADKVELILGDYEIKEENGKTYLVKKQPQYPKTYEECCDVLGISYMQLGVVGYACEKLLYLQRLLLCRDTYWKIAGEQMGLGKPWEPDWLNVMQDKYVLYTHDNNICPNCYVLGNNILAFPTKEIRDTFYENFKDLINETKELL